MSVSSSPLLGPLRDPVVRLYIQVFGVSNAVLIPCALALGFESAPWTHVVLLTPGLSALAVMAWRREPLHTLGLGPGRLGYLPLGLGMVALYCAVTYASGLGVGWLEFSSGFGVEEGFEWALERGVVWGSLAWALGEELGWRGLLSARVEAVSSRKIAFWWCWSLWFAWHLPAMFTGGQTPLELLYQVGCFAGVTMALTALLNELRRQSGSVWPAVIAHAAHNQLACTLADEGFVATTRLEWHGEVGAGVAISSVVVVALYLALVRRSRPAD